MKEKIIVCLDAGHGGRDLGLKDSEGYNVGYNDVLEKNVNLEIATRLGWYLAQHDITYTLTRFGDRYVSLGDRIRFANRSKCSLFISIHCNYAHDANINGFETWYYHNSEIGKRWAEQFNSNLAKLKYSRNRGVKSQNPSFYVLHHTAMPAILLELGFLSNVKDSNKLDDPNMQTIIAENLKETIKQLELDKFA